MIASLPAVTLADAAAHVKVAYGLARGMDGINPPEKMTEFARQIERLTVSAVPIVTQAAGIELESLFLQHDFPRMHTITFKGDAALDEVEA